ncbi:MAG: hypothetical protein IJV55_03580 [Paludibacteraceae bacterium]|nr:hypothetical protein [Paludibacteraceae bacterium]
MKKKLFFVAMAALALAGCNNQPTELNFEEIKTSATVKVYVTYDMGERVENGVVVNDQVVKADATVNALVDYNEYSAGAPGVKQIAAAPVEGQPGWYQVVIPCGQTGVSNVQIEVLGFEAPYYETKDAPINEFYPSVTIPVPTLLPGDLDVEYVVMAISGNAQNTNKSQKLTVSGKVTGVTEALKYKDDELTGTDKIKQSNIAGLELKYVGVSCDLKVTVSTSISGDDRKLVYTAKSDADGNYSINVNYYDAWEITDVLVTVEPQAFVLDPEKDNAFTHRMFAWNKDDSEYRAATQALKGYYDGGKMTDVPCTNGDLLLGKKMGESQLDFTPDDKSAVYGTAPLNDGGEIDGNKRYATIPGGIAW